MFAILDCELIAISKSHQCVRSMSIILEDGITMKYWEFSPCKSFQDIPVPQKKSYTYCYYNVHGLKFYPSQRGSKKCYQAKEVLFQFIKKYGVDIIYYKGGQIERQLCNEIKCPSFNLEYISIPKAYSHNPREEVKFYFEHVKQFVNKYNTKKIHNH